LTNWLIGDGYWSKSDQTVEICTDNFTLDEVQLLLDILIKNLGLNATLKRSVRPNKGVCWRFIFSRKADNIKKFF